jgi:hypothetical protein
MWLCLLAVGGLSFDASLHYSTLISAQPTRLQHVHAVWRTRSRVAQLRSMWPCLGAAGESNVRSLCVRVCYGPHAHTTSRHGWGQRQALLWLHSTDCIAPCGWQLHSIVMHMHCTTNTHAHNTQNWAQTNGEGNVSLRGSATHQPLFGTQIPLYSVLHAAGPCPRICGSGAARLSAPALLVATLSAPPPLALVWPTAARVVVAHALLMRHNANASTGSMTPACDVVACTKTKCRYFL